jgi:small subunit ribosomal protein S15
LAHQTLKDKEHNSKIVEKHGKTANDTGTPEVQVALLTDKINHLTDHLRKHKMDFSSQRGLLKAVGARRRMLDYLRSRSSARYSKLINALDLRK